MKLPHILDWKSTQETHQYEPLYLANGTFGGLLDLSGTDMNLWSSSIVGAPVRREGNHGVHYPVTALRTRVYYRNCAFRERGFWVSRAAILSDNPIYTAHPAMPHKATVYDCSQSLDLHAGIARTAGTLYPGSRSSLLAGLEPDRMIPFQTEVVFLKDSRLLSMQIESQGSEIAFDPWPVLEDKLVVGNSGNSIYSLGNEMTCDIRVTKELVAGDSGSNWIRYILKPEADAAYTVFVSSENGKVGQLNGRPVLIAENALSAQVEIHPQTDSPPSDQGRYASHDSIRKEQARRWKAFWDKSSVQLPEEESEWEQRYRASLFYVAQSVSDSPTHPVGLSQPMLPYWFGSFHDTDTYFCRPLLEAGHFDLAGNNLKFRYRTLKTAFNHAAEAGMPGALYPWQSDPHGNGEVRFVPICQAIIACEAWHQVLYRGDPESAKMAAAIVPAIFENLLSMVDTTLPVWDLQDRVLATFSETIDAPYPDEAVLAIRATAEAYLALLGEAAALSQSAQRILKDMHLAVDENNSYRIVRGNDPEYLRNSSLTLGSWPLRHITADNTMLKTLHKEMSRIVSVFAWIPHQLSALASRLGLNEGPISAASILKEADVFYKTWHAFDEWENRRTARAKVFVTAAGGFCTAIHQMLLAEGEQDTLRIFPGIPPEWRNASFRNLSTQLGWRVSATLENGRITALDVAKIHDNAVGNIKLHLHHPVANPDIIESLSKAGVCAV
jgi:hypothetical protein